MDISSAPLTWTKACYGLDLQDEHTGVVRLSMVRGRAYYTAMGFDDPRFLRGLEQGVPCAACVSSRESFARWVEAPFPSYSKAAKVLPTLLDIQLPFALESCVHLFLETVRTARGTTRALAVAARLTDVSRTLEAFAERGIDPPVLDQEALALWTQSLAEAPQPGGSVARRRGVIYLGTDHSTLVLGCGAEFLSAHPMKSADVEQIGRLLRAHLAAESPSSDGAENPASLSPVQMEWFWCGPGAADADFVAALQAQLDAKWPGPSEVHAEPASFLGRALATRALIRGALRCNLRTGTLEHPLISHRTRSQLIRSALACLAAGVVLCSLNVTYDVLVNRRGAALDRTLRALRNEVAGYRIAGAKGEHALRVVRESVDKQTTELAPFRRPFGPSLTRVIGEAMALAARSDLRYETFSLSRDDLLISGVGPGWTSAEALVSLLVREGFTVQMERREALDDERVPFLITQRGGS